VKRDVIVAAESETAKEIDCPSVSSEEFGAADLVVSFGGDGTLIRAAHLCSERGTPILGTYYGRFGFVTQCMGSEVQACLEQFLKGEAKFETRMMLETDLFRHEAPVLTLHSLNEVVVQRGVTVRIMSFAVTIDGRYLTTYPADGVMVSTATGSTGYNLSAGGPIVVPGVEAMILTPLAPHTLVARTMVLRTDSEIRIELETEGEAVLSADSQVRLHLLTGDALVVRRSPRVTRLMMASGNDFLTKLRTRLFEGPVDMSVPTQEQV
jgi:NAD+ kinase